MIANRSISIQDHTKSSAVCDEGLGWLVKQTAEGRVASDSGPGPQRVKVIDNILLAFFFLQLSVSNSKATNSLLPSVDSYGFFPSFQLRFQLLIPLTVLAPRRTDWDDIILDLLPISSRVIPARFISASFNVRFLALLSSTLAIKSFIQLLVHHGIYLPRFPSSHPLHGSPQHCRASQRTEYA